MIIKHKLGLDFDGVVADPRELKVKLAREIFGKDITADYSKKEFVVQEGLLTTEQYNTLVIKSYETENCLKIAPVKDAVECLDKLLDSYIITIVTSRSPKGVIMAKKWCKQYNFPEIIIVGTDGSDKGAVLNGFTAYVDDDLKKLLPLIGVVPNLFLFTWKYNELVELPKEIVRVMSWKELSEKLMEIRL